MKRLSIALLVLVAALGAGCRSGQKVDPILRLSAEESLTEGKRLMAEEKYAKARPYLSHAFEVAPNSPQGREALLLVADAYFRQGGVENFIQAESRYRDYLNRFPTSEQAAYAQFQIANSLAERAAPPDRDQSPTRSAVQAYEDLLRLYPTSPHGEEARKRLQEVRNRLAAHEWHVGHFYFRRGLLPAAAERLELLLERYPDYPETDEVLFYLGRTYKRMQDPKKARETFQRLRAEHPESQFLEEIPDLSKLVSAHDGAGEGEQKGD